MTTRALHTRRFIRTISAALLLLTLYGCNDVPLDTATFRSDTLAEPVFVGTVGGDTIRPSFTAALPEINWRTLSLTYLREDPLNPGRARRDTALCSADEQSVVELTTVSGGPFPGEYLTIDLRIDMPRRVRDSSVAAGSNMRTYLKELRIMVPPVRVSGNPFPWEFRLNSPPDESDKPGASITLARPINGSDMFKTGRGDSHGELKIMRVDRRNRVMFVHVELEFKLISSGPGSKMLPLDLDLALSY
jgi:hypothetical protein